jgi:hypothetical protein
MKKLIASLTVSAFLYATVAVPFAQASVWEERRDASRQVKSSGDPHPVQVAY